MILLKQFYKKEEGLKTRKWSDASYLICSGCNIVAVSKRLGHENVEITLETYTHLIPKKEDEALIFVEKSSQNLLTHLKIPLGKALVQNP